MKPVEEMDFEERGREVEKLRELLALAATMSRAAHGVLANDIRTVGYYAGELAAAHRAYESAIMNGIAKKDRPPKETSHG